MFLSVHPGALVLLLSCVSSPVGGQLEEFRVEISSKEVILRCPEENSQWEKGQGDALSKDKNGSLIFLTTEQLNEIEKGKEFICSQNHKSWKIYLKIKACEDCVELSFSLGASIVIADLLLTLGILLLVYFCCRKQPTFFRGGLAGGGIPGRQQGQQADHPPPVPNPDYEPIRKGQREVYAGLEPRAF